jgi:hypothetical protein
MAGRNSFQEIVRNIVRSEISSFMGLNTAQETTGNVVPRRRRRAKARVARPKAKRRLKGKGKGRVTRPDDKRLKKNREEE